jgi:DUF971 family protein
MMPYDRAVAAVPTKVETIGEELAILWQDGSETYLKLQDLRRLCPCAGCAGERDLFGRLAKPPQRPLTKESFRLVSTAPVGGYALQLFWGDGHSDGLFSYTKLLEWGRDPPQLPPISVAPLLPSR